MHILQISLVGNQNYLLTRKNKITIETMLKKQIAGMIQLSKTIRNTKLYIYIYVCTCTKLKKTYFPKI